MLILSAVKKLFKNESVEVHMSSIRVNGNLMGCSGFIRHTQTNLIVYISTENNVNLGYLYRCARNLKDFSGGQNRFAKNSEDLFTGVMKLLTDKEIYLNEFGQDFGKSPKLNVADHDRQIAGYTTAFF